MIENKPKRQLRTMKGSVIKRSKYSVGKEIGGQIYFHLDYITDIVPTDEIAKAYDIMKDNYQDIDDYNICVYDPKLKTLRLYNVLILMKIVNRV